MRISGIIGYPVWIGTRNQMLVKVETDEGLFGWGESGLSGREQALVGAVEHFVQFLTGCDPIRIGALWQEMGVVAELDVMGDSLCESGWLIGWHDFVAQRPTGDCPTFCV